jgi:hypothetical protein
MMQNVGTRDPDRLHHPGLYWDGSAIKGSPYIAARIYTDFRDVPAHDIGPVSFALISSVCAPGVLRN